VANPRLVKIKLPKEIKIFFCFIDSDSELVSKIRNHIQGLDRKYNIMILDHTKVLPGADADENIKGLVNSARIMIFFISQELLISDYFRKIEELAFHKHATNEIAIIPVILSPVTGFENTKLEEFVKYPRSNNQNKNNQKNYVTIKSLGLKKRICFC
jgi:hypothetical protein